MGVSLNIENTLLTVLVIARKRVDIVAQDHRASLVVDIEVHVAVAEAVLLDVKETTLLGAGISEDLVSTAQSEIIQRLLKF